MYIKGFNKDLQCVVDGKVTQYEIGGTYDTGYKDGELTLCSKTVIHFCDSIQKVHNYYSCNSDNRFCEIEVLGDIVQDSQKCGSNKIRIIREIVGEELETLIGHINGNTGLFNTGNRNTGDWNTGGCNTGNMNTGGWNKCNYSAGFFCTKEPKAVIFNAQTDMTVSEFRNSKYYDALMSSNFELTKWIYYTKEEMKNDIEKQSIGGYLKSYTYEEACKNWWDNMDEYNKEIVMSIPNFDKKIFKEITGIEL